MANNSSTGGYLAASGTPPLDDQALDRFFHDLIAGVLAFDPTLVRPRWLPSPGNMPAQGINWIAQGVTDRIDEGTVWQYFDQTTNTFQVVRNQELINLVSFYGVNASGNESNLRDGLALDQNREAINLQGISLVRVGDARNASTLLNEQWQKRIDVQIRFRRQIVRTYPVLNILTGAVEIITDTGLTEVVSIT